VLAEILVGFPGEECEITVFVLRITAPVATTNLVAHTPELFGLGDRQRFEHHLMH
jgi:hypothetical protein